MKPESFLQQCLGEKSSHPRFQQKQLRLLLILSGIPVLVLVAFVFVMAADYENWIPMLLSAKWFLFAFGAIVAFATGLLATAALCTRFAALQADKKVAGGKALYRVPTDARTILMLIVGLGLGAIGPFILSRQTFLLPEMSLLFNLFALFPLVTVLVGMMMVQAKGEREGPRVKRSRILCLMFAVALAMLAVTVLSDMAAAYQKTAIRRFLSQWIPFFVSVERPFLGLLVLAPVVFTLYVFWRLWTWTAPPRERETARETDTTREDTPEKLSIWGRLLAWFRGLWSRDKSLDEEDGDSAATGQADADEQPPAWLAGLLEALPEGVTCAAAPEPATVADPEISPISTRTDLRPLFDDMTPTMDQARAVDRFIAAYQESVKESRGIDPTADDEPNAGMILAGQAGSGRTQALLACAIYGAAVRGQRVLIVAPSEKRRSAIQERLGLILDRLSLEGFLRIGAITRESVESWVLNSEPVPYILVGCPRDIEAHLYGAGIQGDEASARLRRLVLLMEVVLVDDLIDFESAERSHLPFLLDKQRLLLAAEYMPFQSVVTCPPLEEIGESLLGVRLYTNKYLDIERDVVAMHPRESSMAWRVNLVAQDVSKAVDKLVMSCLAKGLDVVLYRKGIDENECHDKEGKLQRGASGRLNVIADLDEPLDFPVGKVEAIFYEIARHEDVCLALRLNMGNDKTVIFSLSRSGQPRELTSAGILPVLADRSSMPLLEAHLRSILRFLHTDSPVPTDMWNQFGVNYLEYPRRQHYQTPDVVLSYDEWREEGIYDNNRIWPYVVLKGQHSLANVVDTARFPDTTHEFFRSPQNSWFYLGEPIPNMRRGSRDRPEDVVAQWHDPSETEMPKVDLIRLCEMKLSRANGTFAPGSIEQDDDRRGYRFIVRRWRGDGTDAYLPVFQFKWQLPKGQKAIVRGGGSDHGLLWMELAQPARVCPTVDAGIVKRMNEFGFDTPMPAVSFSYPAEFSAVVFNPTPDLDPSFVGETLGQGLAGEWEVGHNPAFCPAMTSALIYALETRAPGISYFARILVFSLGRDYGAIGSAVAFLVEPRGSGRTAIRYVNELLTDNDARKSLFESMAWLLNEYDAPQIPLKDMVRRYGRIGFYQGDDDISDVSDAKDIVRAVLLGTRRMDGTVPPLPIEPSDRNDPGRFSIEPHVDVLQPTWDSSGTPLPWDQCVDQLRESAVKRCPEANSVDLMGWRNNLHFLVSREGADGGDWHAALRGGPVPKDTSLVTVGNMVGLQPGASMDMHAFADAAVSWLAGSVASSGLDAGTTLILRFWAFPRELSEPLEAGPRLTDPICTLMIGGFSTGGLILVRKERREVAPRPRPQPVSKVPPTVADMLREEPKYQVPLIARPISVSWQEGLPDPPGVVRRGGQSFKWVFRGKDYSIRWGFKKNEDKTDYMRILDGLDSRIQRPYAYYIFNDPYLQSIHSLADKLLSIYDRGVDASFAEFLLAFVQAIPYVPDPEDQPGDWPRFPSEYLANTGGDCEDSSIMYLALLARFGYEAAFLSMKRDLKEESGHAAVGVVGPYNGTYYTKNSKKYHYAETATEACYLPLGAKSGLEAICEVTPYFATRLPAQSPVQILTAAVKEGGREVTCLLASDQPADIPVRVAAYVRATEDVFDGRARAICVGASDVPGQRRPGVKVAVDIQIDLSRSGTGNCHLDLVVWADKKIVGRWAGVQSYVRQLC